MSSAHFAKLLAELRFEFGNAYLCHGLIMDISGHFVNR
jgi:hypothetical protein